MKILLVNPAIPNSYYNQEFYAPSGLLYLGASLRDQGHAVALLDLNTLRLWGRPDAEARYRDEVARAVAAGEPEVVGFGSLFSGHFPLVRRLAEAVKAASPECRVVAGGIHFTIHAQAILEHCPCFDAIVLGEGEVTTGPLLDVLTGRAALPADLDGVALRIDGRVYLRPKRHYVEDLDRLPGPAYAMIDFDDYAVDTSAWHNPKGQAFRTSVPILSSRSCPNRCTFCSMHRTMGPRWRPRSAEHVVAEIAELVERYGQRHVSFMDDNFTLSRSRTLAICEGILRRGLDIQFETPNGLSPKTLDAEVLDALVRAGLTRISLAIESGSDFIRNRVMGKRVSREKILEVVRLVRRHPQLVLKAFFVIGMPEETAETLEDTYKLIREIRADRVYLQNVVPFVGTPVFEQARRDGLLVDVDLDRLHETDTFYTTNYDRFFIKPYALSLVALRTFRERCDAFLRPNRPALAEIGAHPAVAAPAPFSLRGAP